MADPILSPQDQADLRAAEYVLGLLDAAEHSAVAADAARDPVFAARVEAWRERLYPMIDSSDVAPPPHVWAGVEQKIGAAQAHAMPSPISAAANDNVALRKSLKLWRGLAGLAMTVAAVLIVAVAVRQPVSQAPVEASLAAPLVATLSHEGSATAVAVNYDPATGRMIASPIAVSADGHSPELWVIPEDGKPRSLGVMSATGVTAMVLTAQQRQLMRKGVTLALTVEQLGGSPTGLPTSAPIISGKIITI